MAHITGGGLLENLPRVVPDSLAYQLNRDAWQRPPVFSWLAETGGLDETDLLRTFNCGIGFVLVVEAQRADALTELLSANGETVHRLGEIVARTGEAVLFEGAPA